MWFGWKTLNIDKDGMPTEYDSKYEAECFVLFTHVIYVGEVREK